MGSSYSSTPPKGSVYLPIWPEATIDIKNNASKKYCQVGCQSGMRISYSSTPPKGSVYLPIRPGAAIDIKTKCFKTILLGRMSIWYENFLFFHTPKRNVCLPIRPGATTDVKRKWFQKLLGLEVQNFLVSQYWRETVILRNCRIPLWISPFPRCGEGIEKQCRIPLWVSNFLSIGKMRCGHCELWIRICRLSNLVE